MVSVMDRSTLKLNSSWQFIGFTTIQDGITKIWNGNATAICPDTFQEYTWSDWSKLEAKADLYIPTHQGRIRFPEVIKCNHYGRVPRVSVPFSRRNIHKRDNYTCQYCGKMPGSKELSIDHIVPSSKGGKSTWENCVLACTSCNKRKSDLSLRASGLHLLSIPSKPNWSPTYAIPNLRLDSWSKFVSAAYWNVPLEE